MTEVPQLVLICGYARHGKDTLFKRGLCPLHYDVYGKRADRPFPRFHPNRIAFADKVKEEVAARLTISVEELESDKESYRPYLIEVANSARDKDPYHWCRQAFDRSSVGVVTDLRFPEELAYARALSGIATPPCIIRVHRLGVAIPDRPSEHALDELQPDFVVTTAGTCVAELAKIFPYLAGYHKLSI